MVVGKAGEARDSGSVGEEIVDGDFVPRGGGVGHVFLDGIIDFEFAALLQEKDGGRGELLGDGAEAEFCSGRVGDAPLEIGEAVGFVEDGGLVAGDEDGAHELFCGDVGLDDFFEAGGVCVLRSGDGR
jgi:hypothetical protein